MSTTTERPPYDAYAAIMGAFAGGLGVAGVAARVLGRDPQCQTLLDLTVLSAASFKAARTLSADEVTSFLREPFVRGHAHEGDEEPVESGDIRQAIGELLTCSRCVGTWAAAGLAVTKVLAPLRPVADVVAGGSRDQRLLAGRLHRADEQGRRARRAARLSCPRAPGSLRTG